MRATLTNNPLLAAALAPTTPPLQAAVLRRDRHICRYCSGYATEVDHVEPRAQGGLTIWSNLVAACQRCNREKGNQTPQQWEAAKLRRAAQMVALRSRAMPKAQPVPLKTAKRIPLKKARRIPGYQPPTPTLAQLLRASQSPSRQS